MGSLALVGKHKVKIVIGDAVFMFAQVNARQRMEFLASVIDMKMEHFDTGKEANRLKTDKTPADKKKEPTKAELVQTFKDNAKFHQEFGPIIDAMMVETIQSVSGAGKLNITSQEHEDERATMFQVLLDNMTDMVQYQELRMRFTTKQITGGPEKNA